MEDQDSPDISTVSPLQWNRTCLSCRIVATFRQGCTTECKLDAGDAAFALSGVCKVCDHSICFHCEDHHQPIDVPIFADVMERIPIKPEKIGENHSIIFSMLWISTSEVTMEPLNYQTFIEDIKQLRPCRWNGQECRALGESGEDSPGKRCDRPCCRFEITVLGVSWKRWRRLEDDPQGDRGA